MATRILSRSLITKLSSTTTSSSLARSFSSSSAFGPLRLRPIAVAVSATLRSTPRPVVLAVRGLATRSTSSSLNDPNPNWSNRPPKETILLDGCDFEHWLVVLEKPEGEPTRDEIIDSYIKTLAMVVGSEEEARMKIYSVSTRHYFAFGALVSEELSYKLKELPKVRWVLPDSYLDVKNKDYGGEPFINGQAVPYDPKYHEEWVRNNARAQDRNRRNDRPRNFDRSRNFERRRENMQNRDVENRGPPPPNMAPSPGPGNFSPHNAPPNSMQPPQSNGPQNNFPPPNSYPQSSYSPQNKFPPHPPPPQNNFPPQNNYTPRPPPQNNFAPQPNYPPQNNMGNFQQPIMNNPAPRNANNFIPQNNSMPPQYNVTRTPSNEQDVYPAPNGINPNYEPGSGVPGGRPY